MAQLWISHLSLGARRSFSLHEQHLIKIDHSLQYFRLLQLWCWLRRKTSHPFTQVVVDDSSADAWGIVKEPIHVAVLLELRCLIDISDATSEQTWLLMTRNTETSSGRQGKFHRPQQEKILSDYVGVSVFRGLQPHDAICWGIQGEVSEARNTPPPITGLLTLTF